MEVVIALAVVCGLLWMFARGRERKARRERRMKRLRRRFELRRRFK